MAHLNQCERSRLPFKEQDTFPTSKGTFSSHSVKRQPVPRAAHATYVEIKNINQETDQTPDSCKANNFSQGSNPTNVNMEVMVNMDDGTIKQASTSSEPETQFVLIVFVLILAIVASVLTTQNFEPLRQAYYQHHLARR